MKKQIVSLALAFFFVATLLPTPGLAYDTGTAGQSNIISAGFNIVGVLGGGHTGFVDKSGALWMWGGNSNGQLGNGTTDSSDVPVKVLDNVTAVSCGSCYTAAIKTDGTLWMWGGNYRGRLGNGTTEDSLVPVKVLDNVAAVSCGGNHTAAIKADGTLWIWGRNEDGQLGNGTTEDSLVPVKVLDNVAAVSCGGDHTAAIKTDGTLWTWGENGRVQLGNGGGGNAVDAAGANYQTVPVKVLDNVATVSCGVDHTAAIKTDGTLWMWGPNENGELGNGGGGNLVIDYTNGSVAYQTVPVKVLDNVAAISCGYVCTAAIKTDGSLWMWGRNEQGVLGNGGGGNAVNVHGDTCQTVPIRVLDNVAAVSCGSVHTAAIKTDGTLWMWGCGQLGNGNNEMANSPIQIAGLNAFLDVPSYSDPAADITADVVAQEAVNKASAGSFPTGAIIAVAAGVAVAVVLVLKKKKAQAAAPAAVAAPPAQAAPIPTERSTPKFCSNCGQPLEADARFCPNCGKSLGKS